MEHLDTFIEIEILKEPSSFGLESILNPKPTIEVILLVRPTMQMVSAADNCSYSACEANSANGLPTSAVILLLIIVVIHCWWQLAVHC